MRSFVCLRSDCVRERWDDEIGVCVPFVWVAAAERKWKAVSIVCVCVCLMCEGVFSQPCLASGARAYKFRTFKHARNMRHFAEI